MQAVLHIGFWSTQEFSFIFFVVLYNKGSCVKRFWIAFTISPGQTLIYVNFAERYYVSKFEVPSHILKMLNYLRRVC